MNIIILIQLLLAHVLTDFVFQTTKGLSDKKNKGLNSKYFWLHIFLSGILTYIFLQQWKNWQIPLFIMITHIAIDFWKITRERKINDENATITDPKAKKTGTKYFFIDQFLHLIVILIAWLYMIDKLSRLHCIIEQQFTNTNSMTVLTAIILLIWPVGITIGKIVEPFKREMSTTDDSLSKAGIYIGIFERLLIFIFIMIGQYAAIGFLIAAKSILRVSTERDDDGIKKTEYVLIGTLISFTLAIVVSLLARYIYNH